MATREIDHPPSPQRPLRTMKRTEFEAMGDRHKAFEARETMHRTMPGLPVMVRLDGRAFHTFTRGLQRPYDERLRRSMIETTKYLVDQTHASVGYTQSDEISLAYPNIDVTGQILFDGRIQKLCSVLAAMATAKFNQQVQVNLPEKAHLLPLFDARVFQYPTLELAAESFLWREADASRNALTMAAHAAYSHKELHKAGVAKKHELLAAKGISLSDYPVAFTRGVYVRRESRLRELSAAELARIPEKHRPTGPVMRSAVLELDMPPLAQVANPIDVLFKGAEPVQAPAGTGPALED